MIYEEDEQQHPPPAVIPRYTSANKKMRSADPLTGGVVTCIDEDSTGTLTMARVVGLVSKAITCHS